MDPLHRAPSSTLPQRVRPRPAVSIASRVYAAHLPTPALLTRSSYFLRLLANTPFQIQVLVRLPSLPLHGIERALPGRVREDGHPGEGGGITLVASLCLSIVILVMFFPAFHLLPHVRPLCLFPPRPLRLRTSRIIAVILFRIQPVHALPSIPSLRVFARPTPCSIHPPQSPRPCPIFLIFRSFSSAFASASASCHVLLLAPHPVRLFTAPSHAPPRPPPLPFSPPPHPLPRILRCTPALRLAPYAFPAPLLVSSFRVPHLFPIRAPQTPAAVERKFAKLGACMWLAERTRRGRAGTRASGTWGMIRRWHGAARVPGREQCGVRGGAGEVYAESRCQRASSPGGVYPRRAARKNIAGAGVVRAEGAEAHGGRLAAWAQRVACDTGAGGDAGVGLLDVRGARLAVFASGADRG
ncbi:hypothetical protein B0H17DRAFT_1339208 [Mycena rosella]|uniref:Uncharacterized protein n=1 Tax=Mycena rosella TaxID=1033263 RepID=A0AAD7FTS5_MYCRO|nr:hypothetical protein B0H17DRAFT_1339208 [Mycena rosella]